MSISKFVKVFGTLILALGLLLQAYLRLFPYVRSGCQWPDNSEHKIVAFGDPQIIGYLHLHKYRKQLDILGNDRYLAQVAESVRDATNPEYVIVLGDLLSSQWIATDEFEKRTDRYKKIFRADGQGEIVNVTGNHDIGYHSEITDERVERYLRRYGELNTVINSDPEWRLVVLNSLSLDGPPFNDIWQNQTMDFLESLKGFEGTTVLATHIPLYKSFGICHDGPKFDYYPEDQGSGLKQQNHLSWNATNAVLNTVFERKGGIILTGHDHEGCFSSYRRSTEDATVWDVVPGLENGDVQEATVRSIMGEFGGNSGLASAIRDPETNELYWKFTLCRFHIQHIWWVSQVLTIIGAAASPIILAL